MARRLYSRPMKPGDYLILLPGFPAFWNPDAPPAFENSKGDVFTLNNIYRQEPTVQWNGQFYKTRGAQVAEYTT